MGATVSRDHAKLPFGYTHARKDHACSTSTTASGSRRRLASRLLRTSDTTSVTPFPIQDGSTSVASIPEMVLVLPPSIPSSSSPFSTASLSWQQQQQQQQHLPGGEIQPAHAHALPHHPQSTTQAQTLATQNNEMVPYSGRGVATAEAAAANPSLAASRILLLTDAGASAGASSSPAQLPFQQAPTNADVFSRSQTDSQGCCSCSLPASCCCADDSASLTAHDHAPALCHHSHRPVNKKIAAGVAGEAPTDEQQHQVTESTSAAGSTSSAAASSTPLTSAPLAVDPGSCSSVALTSSNLHHAHTSSYSIAASSSSESHGYNSVNASRGNSSATTATMATTFSFASLSSSSLSPSSRYDQEPFSSIQQKPKKSTFTASRSQHQLRTQQEMDNDMDIISALGIADQPYERGMHDYFSIGNGSSILARSSPASSPPAALPYPHLPHHASQHHVPMKPDLMSRMPDHQEDSETTAVVPKRALTYELGTHHSGHRNDYDYGLDEDEDEDDLDEEGNMGIISQRRKKPSPPSILDEDMEPLSPFPFSDLPSLTNIGLCTRGIVKLSSNIKLLSSATCVQICCNDLVQIPVEIGFLRNLTLLDLSKNKLTSLPESIVNLSKLVDLKLSNNELVVLPDGIGGLTKLAVLAVDGNRLESLPSLIGNLKGLVHLDLSNNPLTVLPAEVGKLQYLRRLFLDRCPLVEEFVHSPLHSPPTLLELAARVLVRHDLNVPAIVPQHLKAYIKSAQRCTFCDGPYFDSWVKRGKMIDKNDMFIPLEYTLCQPHWNTELERVKLLFCKRPITSPSPWIPPPPPQSSVRTLGSGKNNTHPPTLTLSNGSLSSSSPLSSNATGNNNSSNNNNNTNSSTGYSFNAAPRPTRNGRKNTVDSNGEQQSSPRGRPLSVIGNRLSMLISRRSSRSESRSPATPPMRERPQSAILRSSNRSSWIPSFSSSSQENNGDADDTPATATTATLRSSSRPAGIAMRNATTQLLERTGLRTRNNRPLSLGSAMMESSPAILTSAAYSSPLSTAVPLTSSPLALHPASPSRPSADAI